MPKQFIRLLLGKREAFGNKCEAGNDAFVAFVLPLLLVAGLDEKVAVGAFGQFGFHLGLAAAKHVGLDAVVELLEVAVGDGASAVVEFVVLAVAPEQRPQQ